MLVRKPTLILTCNKDLKLYFQPITTVIILTNREAPYNNESRASIILKTSHDPILLASLRRRLPKCKPHAALCYIFCRQKYATKIPTSTEAPRHEKDFRKVSKFSKFKILNIFWALFWPLFGLLGLLSTQPNITYGLGSYSDSPDVSTTFPANCAPDDRIQYHLISKTDYG